MNEPRKHSILLVDDEPEVLFSLKGLLRREFNLHTAETGSEAMEILARHEIHVVMTDQRMPEMTGVELVQRVKCQYPEAIRIVFTGYADIKSVIDAINKGGLYRYITKPWDPDELVELLREAVAEYDKIVQGKQLLADLQDYVRRCQDVIAEIRNPEVGTPDARADIESLFQIGNALLDRLRTTGVSPSVVPAIRT